MIAGATGAATSVAATTVVTTDRGAAITAATAVVDLIWTRKDLADRYDDVGPELILTWETRTLGRGDGELLERKLVSPLIVQPVHTGIKMIVQRVPVLHNLSQILIKK
ncbi:hypothetical protein PC129_g25514 [Phytophthora cactorum]|uniref:Uncharacterized protein n=1 Tax=Phytophthora cactorum TaxID=29920 RepID=A0A8T1GP19_9STRA|nr:hypothetical protein PC122_g13024 [Phytophthora cactorum]KAG3157768.1 hypothetical protein C6341_g14655 [Phytophthora cactorum]KAG3177684.1 hypothetical protein PC129_g25514 [Phytophthora cactorum]